VERIDALMKSEGSLAGAQGAAVLPGLLSLDPSDVERHSSLNSKTFRIKDLENTASPTSEWASHPTPNFC
jgi:hypothetical protein